MSPQNGKAERVIRTVNDTSIPLLFQTSMPPTYLSRIPPYCHLRPSPPPVPLLPFFQPHPHTFGCLRYPNTVATMPHKLSHRYVACVFLGYASKNRDYCCMDLETPRILFFRHVVFDETRFPFGPDFLSLTCSRRPPPSRSTLTSRSPCPHALGTAQDCARTLDAAPLHAAQGPVRLAAGFRWTLGISSTSRPRSNAAGLLRCLRRCYTRIEHRCPYLQQQRLQLRVPLRHRLGSSLRLLPLIP
jgi:hypothetical protein